MKDTKPFNLEHAKAGAPIACEDGKAVTILKWDGAGSFGPLVGCMGPFDVPAGWSNDGRYQGPQPRTCTLDLVMTPLGYIDGKPVFVGDVFVNAFGNSIEAMPGMKEFTGCRWPAPAKQYPVTGMTEDEMVAVIKATPDNYRDSYEAIANAALRHAIDNGQVIPLDQHVREIGEAIAEQGRADRAARDMAIAEAVRDAIHDEYIRADRALELLAINSVDLSAVISKVQA